MARDTMRHKRRKADSRVILVKYIGGRLSHRRVSGEETVVSALSLEHKCRVVILDLDRK